MLLTGVGGQVFLVLKLVSGRNLPLPQLPLFDLFPVQVYWLVSCKSELGREAIKSGLLSFTRVASGCEGLSLSPDVTWLM